MLLVGIDVLILAVFGLALIFASYVGAVLIPLTKDAGWASIISTAITAASMVIAYVVMTKVLDHVLGAFGW